MSDKQKIIILISSIVAIVALIIGGTYAYWSWSTAANQQTAVTFTVTPEFSCSADAGGNITSNDKKLAPSDCMDPEYAIRRTITTSSTTSNDKVVSMDLWLNVNSVSANLLASDNFKYALTKNKNSCTSGAYSSGVIGDDVVNGKINLLEGAEYATLTDTYYLYIWLDEEEDNPNTMNQSFDLSIGGECSDSGLEKASLVNFSFFNHNLYFKEADYKTKIKEIHFIYDDDLPNGVIENQVSGKEPYQLSTNANRPIYGYLNQINDTDTYKLYIMSKYKIYAGSLERIFENMTGLQTITFDNFDTSSTTTMSNMFYGCSGLTELDLSNFNTSNVTNMDHMFSGCKSLMSLNVSRFDTSSVRTSMAAMFYNCSGLTSLDVSSFNTINVADMGGMFQKCSNLTSLDLSNFNTSNVSAMSQMFRECASLTRLDVSNFDTSHISNMFYMFAECTSLTTIDLSSFNTTNLTSSNRMFNGCSSLRTIYVSDGWNLDGVTDSTNMFYYCSLLPNFNSSKVDKTNAHYGPGGYLTYKAYS